MTITKIQEKKGGKRLISLNDEPAFVLTEAQVRELGLTEHMEIDEDILARVRGMLYRNGVLRAMLILEKRDKTEFELRQKLKEDCCDDELVDEILSFAREKNYVNDLRYAQNFIRNRQQEKSRKELKGLLRMHGVGEDDIEEAFSSEETEDERSAIERWMKKKRFDPENADESEKRKFIAFLVRKGFPYGAVKEAFSGFGENSI